MVDLMFLRIHKKVHDITQVVKIHRLLESLNGKI